MAHILDIQEFFIEGGKAHDSHVLLHIAEPSSPGEENKGYFFAVTEIRHGTVGLIEQMQQLIDDLQSRYYTAASTVTKDAFERAIEFANRRGHHILQFRTAETHCVVGVLRGGALAIAAHGNPEAALVYRRDGERAYLDILDGGEGDPERLFSAVLEGAVNTDDCVYIATSRVRAAFPPDRVQSLISGRSVKQSVEHMERVLRGLRDDASYGGILFRPTDGNGHNETGASHPPPDRLTGGETDRTLYAETGIPRRGKSRTPSMPMGAATIIDVGKKTVLALAHIARSAIRGIGRACVFLFIALSNKGGQRSMVVAQARAACSAYAKRMENLPIGTKIIAAASVTALALLAVGIGVLHWREQVRARTVESEAILQAIREKKDAADARLIYGEKERAYALLQEALALLPVVQGAKPDAAAKEEVDIRGRMDRVVAALRKWREVQSSPLVNLRDATPDAAAQKLTAIGGVLVAYGPEDDTLYRIVPETKNIERIARPGAIPPLRAGNVPKEDTEIVFIAGNASLAAYDKETGRIVGRDISFPRADARIADLFVYNQRLFTLYPGGNQIYRHARTQTGFDRGVPWVSSAGSSTLEDAVSFAIDGDIFVATAKGAVQKWTAGILMPFAGAIDPPLQNPAALWTYNNVERLYILEPAHKRLIVLDKNGGLLAQYTDPAWKGPTGMVIDESKKIAYILDNQVVYTLKLTD